MSLAGILVGDYGSLGLGVDGMLAIVVVVPPAPSDGAQHHFVAHVGIIIPRLSISMVSLCTFYYSHSPCLNGF